MDLKLNSKDVRFTSRDELAVSDSYLSLSDQDPKSDNSTPESSEWRCNSNLVRRDSEYCCSATNMQRLRYYFAAPAVAVRHDATISR